MLHPKFGLTRDNQVTKMLRASVPACVVAAFLIIGVTGCEKKSGEAVVIGKDYVAAVKQGEEINDERATNHEQWIVKVRMRDNGRTMEVRASRAQLEKLRENDRVEVTYRVVSILERFGTPRLTEKRTQIPHETAAMACATSRTFIKT